ncbi:MAG TPA: anti-sigma factor [Chloroflexota bacterium]|nr:anti-sigma factor [Chloroflexota bacterium]
MREMTADTGQGREGGHGDAVAYLLGALDAAARERFEAHVSGCPECLRELEELRPVADQLALSVPQVDPPPSLSRRLLVRAHAMTPAMPPPPPGASSTFPGVAARPPGQTGQTVRANHATPAAAAGAEAASRSAWGRWAERLSAPVATVALVVALVSGGMVYFQHDEVEKATQTNALLSETLSIMYQPGRIARELSGEYGNPLSKGTVYMNPEGNDAVLVAYNLPKLAAREIYQVWLNNPEAEQRVSGGTFKVDDRGRGHLIVRAPSRLSQYKYCGVTKEPESGSPKPTGQRVLNGSIAP